MKKQLENIENVVRAKTRRSIPVVLSKYEIKQFFLYITPNHIHMFHLMYGANLSLIECVRLGIKDIDFHYKQITIRDSKGSKNRVVPCTAKPH